MLPLVFKSVYPNPPAITAYDPAVSAAGAEAAPAAGTLAPGVAAAVDQATPGTPVFDAAVGHVRRVSLVHQKSSCAHWRGLREELGPAGGGAAACAADPRAAELKYGEPPSIMSKFGL